MKSDLVFFHWVKDFLADLADEGLLWPQETSQRLDAALAKIFSWGEKPAEQSREEMDVVELRVKLYPQKPMVNQLNILLDYLEKHLAYLDPRFLPLWSEIAERVRIAIDTSGKTRREALEGLGITQLELENAFIRFSHIAARIGSNEQGSAIQVDGTDTQALSAKAISEMARFLRTFGPIAGNGTLSELEVRTSEYGDVLNVATKLELAALALERFQKEEKARVEREERKKAQIARDEAVKKEHDDRVKAKKQAARAALLKILDDAPTNSDVLLDVSRWQRPENKDRRDRFHQILEQVGLEPAGMLQGLLDIQQEGFSVSSTMFVNMAKYAALEGVLLSEDNVRALRDMRPLLVGILNGRLSASEAEKGLALRLWGISLSGVVRESPQKRASIVNDLVRYGAVSTEFFVDVVFVGTALGLAEVGGPEAKGELLKMLNKRIQLTRTFATPGRDWNLEGVVFACLIHSPELRDYALDQLTRAASVSAQLKENFSYLNGLSDDAIERAVSDAAQANLAFQALVKALWAVSETISFREMLSRIEGALLARGDLLARKEALANTEVLRLLTHLLAKAKAMSETTAGEKAEKAEVLALAGRILLDTARVNLPQGTEGVSTDQQYVLNFIAENLSTIAQLLAEVQADHPLLVPLARSVRDLTNIASLEGVLMDAVRDLLAPPRAATAIAMCAAALEARRGGGGPIVIFSPDASNPPKTHAAGE